MARNKTKKREFQSTLPVGGATQKVTQMAIFGAFQSTLPVGGATIADHLGYPTGVISIHAPRGGSDCSCRSGTNSSYNFNPRSPWGERLVATFYGVVNPDFNPRSPWGERPNCRAAGNSVLRFQSTLPVGGATRGLRLLLLHNRFQSTLPVGGATLRTKSGPAFQRYFNPRSPWGERLIWDHFKQFCGEFQSTLPVGGATRNAYQRNRLKEFQSTLPVGGATIINHAVAVVKVISIHAPRGGSDRQGKSEFRYQKNFNPRSPWGERLQIAINASCENVFQSTLPVGGATPASAAALALLPISIHAPRGGSDNCLKCSQINRLDFNPRSPWGERPPASAAALALLPISIHAPRGGSDDDPRGKKAGK